MSRYIPPDGGPTRITLTDLGRTARRRLQHTTRRPQCRQASRTNPGADPRTPEPAQGPTEAACPGCSRRVAARTDAGGQQDAR